MTRLTYETVGIGIIAQRIAECRAINRMYDPYLYHIITQQINTLEEKYRDSIVGIGNKILAIEFKSPEPQAEGKLHYDNIQMEKLREIKRNLENPRNPYESVFIGLMHAYLAGNKKLIDQVRNNATGLNFWYAVPMTTAFIPFEEFDMEVESCISRHLDLKPSLQYSINKVSVKALGSDNVLYRNDLWHSLIPSCNRLRQQRPQLLDLFLGLKVDEICKSCGGLYESACCIDRFPILVLSKKCRVTRWGYCDGYCHLFKAPLLNLKLRVEVSVKTNSSGSQSTLSFDCESQLTSFTLASLLHMLFRCCIGTRIESEDDLKRVEDVMRIASMYRGYYNTLMIAYDPKLGMAIPFQPPPLD